MSRWSGLLRDVGRAISEAAKKAKEAKEAARILKETEIAREAAREAERKLEEAQKAIKEETENLKKKVEDEIKNGAKSLKAQDVVAVLEEFKDKIPPDVTDVGKKYVDAIEEIKNQYKALTGALDIEQIKRDILHKAEQFCEEYVKDKLRFLNEIEVNVKGVPKVSLGFDSKNINVSINIYIIPKDKDENSYLEKWLLLFTGGIIQDISKLDIPDIPMDFKRNKRWIESEMEKIQNELIARKKDVTLELIKSILQDYIPPLRILNETIQLFG